MSSIFVNLGVESKPMETISALPTRHSLFPSFLLTRVCYLEGGMCVTCSQLKYSWFLPVWARNTHPDRQAVMPHASTLIGRKLSLSVFPCPECELASVLSPEAGSHMLEWDVRRTLGFWANGLRCWTSYHLRKVNPTVFTPVLGVFGINSSDSLLLHTLPQEGRQCWPH